MNSDEFPECCGAVMLFDFRQEMECLDKHEQEAAIEETEHFLKNQIRLERGCCAYFLLILAGTQIEFFGPTVRKLGWRRIFSRVNKNTGAECRLYARDTDEAPEI